MVNLEKKYYTFGNELVHLNLKTFFFKFKSDERGYGDIISKTQFAVAACFISPYSSDNALLKFGWCNKRRNYTGGANSSNVVEITSP